MNYLICSLLLLSSIGIVARTFKFVKNHEFGPWDISTLFFIAIARIMLILPYVYCIVHLTRGK